MSQTSYSINQQAANAGQLYDIGENDIISMVDQIDLGGVGFGLALSQGVNDNDCKLPSSAADVAKVMGVSVKVQSKEQQLLTGIVNYPKGSDISIIRKGRIWVQVEEAVTPASSVFVRFASGPGGTQLGSFRASADTASAAQLVGGVAYRSSASAGGYAIVEFNFPA